MDLKAIVQIILIAFAAWVAVRLFMEYGPSWQFFLGGPAIVFVTWLILFSLNVGMPSIRNEGQKAGDQLQDLVGDALPVLPISDQDNQNDEEWKKNPSDVVLQQPGQIPQSLVQQPQQQQSLQPQPIATPKDGDIRFWGNRYPESGDNFALFQWGCYNRDTILQNLLKGCPYGWRCSISTDVAGVFRGMFDEDWTMKATPTKGNPFVIKIKGDDADSLREAWGWKESVIGTTPWPQVRQIFKGGKWLTPIDPVTCQ